jgi:hypothetical protein
MAFAANQVVKTAFRGMKKGFLGLIKQAASILKTGSQFP